MGWLVRSADKTVKVWDPKGQCVHTFTDHTDMVRARLLMPDTTDELTDHLARGMLQVWAVAFDPTGAMLASASDDKSIIVYNVAH